MATQEELEQLVSALTTRLSALENRAATMEKELAELKKQSAEEIPEDVLIAISGAVSAYMGNRGKVRAVHFSRHRTWSQQGRHTVQNKAPMHHNSGSLGGSFGGAGGGSRGGAAPHNSRPTTFNNPSPRR